MAITKTPVQIMNAVRPTVFDTMVSALSAVYGEDNVYRVGDTEIAVKVDVSPDGEPIYATFSPTVKNYTDRTTKTKTIYAYNAPKMAEEYTALVAKREEDAAKKAEDKAKKTARDAKVRAEKARKIAEAKAQKNAQ